MNSTGIITQMDKAGNAVKLRCLKKIAEVAKAIKSEQNSASYLLAHDCYTFCVEQSLLPLMHVSCMPG